MIHYQDDQVVIHHGDCIEVLAELPDNSVHAVVTDPPYGLEFMGKDWDSFRTYAGGNPNMKPQGASIARRGGGEWQPGSSHGYRQKNPRCRRCGKLLRGNGACKCPEPQIDTRTAESANIYQAWCEDWARETWRVLKPGGHILAFGGSRTWHRLAAGIEDAGFEIRDSIAWLYGSGFPKSRNLDGDWQGWGTALKPAHEPVVVAQKPLPLNNILLQIGYHLDDMEATWQAPEADPTTPTGAADASSDQTDTSASASMVAMSSSTVTSWRRCWDELCEQTNTFTTSTSASLTTDLKTLSSCISQITHANTTPGGTNPHGWMSIVSAVDNLFASAVCVSRATLALSVIETATGATPTEHQDAEGHSRGAFEPIVVGRKPFRGSVSANVLERGTGAINIDACRVGSGGQLKWDTPRDMGYHGGTDSAGKATANDSGRWPTNVLLDESQAAELDRQSGTQKSGVAVQRNGGGQKIFGGIAGGQNNAGARADVGYGDTGGASRFFPTFRYTAKASASERPKLDGQGHPTVKPLELMRWLVRLVTPPDGIVLEPFAGSGTTVEACLREGKRCIAIERDDTYLQLIVNRIDQTQLGFDIGA